MKLFPMEIQDQMNFHALKISNQILHCVLYFDEYLNQVLMSKAIRLSIAHEPILGCWLSFESSNPFWEERSDLDRLEWCQVVETDTIENALEDFIVKPIKPESDPLIQVSIFRNMQSGDCLCIKISHVVSDGGGLKKYISLLSKLYTGLVFESTIPIDKTVELDRGQSQLIEVIDCQAKKVLEEKSVNFMQSGIPNWSFPVDGYLRTRPAFVFEQIRDSQFNDLQMLAKRQNVTINDLLLTALCLTLKKEARHPVDRPMMIQVPIDLRRYHSGKKLPICNLTGAEYLKMSINDNETFSDCLFKVSTAMKGIKSDFPGLASALAINGLSQLNFNQAKAIVEGGIEKSIDNGVSIPILTNMGAIPDDCQKYGNLSAIDGYLVSPLMFSPGLMVGVSSFGNILTLSVGFCEGSVAKKVIVGLLSGIRTELAKVADMSETSRIAEVAKDV